MICKHSVGSMCSLIGAVPQNNCGEWCDEWEKPPEKDSNVVNPLLGEVPDDIADFMLKSIAYLTLMIDDKDNMKTKVVELGEKLMSKYKLYD